MTTTAAAQNAVGESAVFAGLVVHGDARGRLLGFPTANLDPDDHLTAPPVGVWVAEVEVADWALTQPLLRRAALSVGTNPTYGGTTLRVEAHLLDFDGDLYGRRMSVRALAFVRATVAFTTEAALIHQITADVEHVRDWTPASRGG